MAEEFFKKIGEDWKKGFEKFKDGVDKTFNISPKKGSSDSPQITNGNQNENYDDQKHSSSVVEHKPAILDQWNEGWKNFTSSAQQTLTKWQEDWEAQTKQLQERNQQNSLIMKRKTEEFNQNVKTFFTNQQTAFNNKIQEMEAKYKQRNMEQKAVVDEMTNEWNAFIDDSKATFKKLQKSQDRIFWKTTAYWMGIIIIFMGAVYLVLYLLRRFDIMPTT